MRRPSRGPLTVALSLENPSSRMSDPKPKAATAIQAAFRGRRERKRTAAAVAEARARREAEGEVSSPYLPTPPDAIAAFLDLASVRADDVVLDLGCGDARVVVAAAERRGARGVGVENAPGLLERAAGVRDAVADEEARARVVLRACSVDSDEAMEEVGRATVVFLFMLPAVTALLAPALRQRLPRGARVVSYVFPLGDACGWEPAEVLPVRSDATSLYLYRVE